MSVTELRRVFNRAVSPHVVHMLRPDPSRITFYSYKPQTEMTRAGNLNRGHDGRRTVVFANQDVNESNTFHSSSSQTTSAVWRPHVQIDNPRRGERVAGAIETP
jgi:hypothetical protein